MKKNFTFLFLFFTSLLFSQTTLALFEFGPSTAMGTENVTTDNAVGTPLFSRSSLLGGSNYAAGLNSSCNGTLGVDTTSARSGNGWHNTNQFYQMKVNTQGFSGLTVSCCLRVSSAPDAGTLQLRVSKDGNDWTNVGNAISFSGTGAGFVGVSELIPASFADFSGDVFFQLLGSGTGFTSTATVRIDNLKLTGTAVPIPDNNDCSSPRPLANPGPQMLSMQSALGATLSDAADGSCSSVGLKDVFYKVNTVADGNNGEEIIISVSGLNTYKLYAYLGTTCAATPIDCSSNGNLTINGDFLRSSRISGPRDASSEIVIRVATAENSTFDISASGSALPVKLTSFTGQQTDEVIQLDWSTSSEINSDYFDVQSSFDGKNFTSIGKVKSAGTSSSKINYTHIDEAPYKGTNYYRLKQVDIDGKSETFDIISVENKTPSNTAIYPTLRSKMEVNYIDLTEYSKDENITISLFDIKGQSINQNTIKGGTIQSIDFGQLNTGLYFVKIANNYKSETLKFSVY